MNNQDIMNAINRLRLDNKGSWYAHRFESDQGHLVEVKGYGTWLQIFRIDGTNHSNPMAQSATQFKAWVNDTLAKTIGSKS